jgi:hypothetical protein
MLNVKYLNNIFGMVFPITVQRMVQDKVMDIGYTDSGIGYRIKIQDIIIQNIYFTTKTIAYVPGTNNIRLTIDGLNVDMQVDGTIYGLWFIPVDMGYVNITNISMQVDFAAPSSDNLHWQLIDSNYRLDLDDFQFHLKNSFFQPAVNLMHGSILKTVKANLPQALTFVQAQIDGFNAAMKNAKDDTFLVNLFSQDFLLNITTTHAPQADAATNMLHLNLDGTFYDVAEETNHVRANKIYATHVDGDNGNSQQIFVHQSMIGSLFFGLASEFFPLLVNSTSVTGAVTSMFGEIKDYYGDQLVTDLELTVYAADGNFITLNRTAGIEIGKKSPAGLKMMIFCANATTPRELAVEFDMDLKAVVNVSLDNYFINLHVPEVEVVNVQKVQDKVGMFKRDYQMLISLLMEFIANDYNDQYRTPVDLKSLWPEFMMLIANVFTYPRISPFYENEFMYLGLSYFLDIFTLSSSMDELAKLQEAETLLTTGKHAHAFRTVLNHVLDKVARV